MKYFAGDDIHFIAFEKNLFKDEHCIHIKNPERIIDNVPIYKVAGTELPTKLDNEIMERFFKETNELYVMKESILYKPIT